MIAAIPAPRELLGMVKDQLGDNGEGEAWVMTTDASLIAAAGSSAIYATKPDETGVIEALNAYSDVPSGFTLYTPYTTNKYTPSNDQTSATKHLRDLAFKLWVGEKDKYGGNDLSTTHFKFLVKRPAIKAHKDATAVDVLSQARITPGGVVIGDTSLKLLYKPNLDDRAVAFSTTWHNGRREPDPNSWSLVRTAVIGQGYLVRKDGDNYRLVYAPSKVKALTTRRMHDNGKPRKPVITAHTSLYNIVSTFHSHCWRKIGLDGLANSGYRYRTNSLGNCGQTIVLFAEVAKRIGRTAACRKDYKQWVHAAWHHRRMLANACNSEFNKWFMRELKVLGEPAEAKVIRKAEKAELRRKALRIKQIQEKLDKLKGKADVNRLSETALPVHTADVPCESQAVEDARQPVDATGAHSVSGDRQG